MKVALLVVSFCVSSFAVPALADSIPPPVTSFATTETVMAGYFSSPSSYDIFGINVPVAGICATGPCLEFEVSSPGAGFGPFKDNSAQLWSFTSHGANGQMFGNLIKLSFDPKTDILSGLFSGQERFTNSLSTISENEWQTYHYHVQGSFTENLATGVGSLNLTQETFTGTTTVPEPGTLLTLASGLLGIAGVARRKLTAALRL